MLIKKLKNRLRALALFWVACCAVMISGFAAAQPTISPPEGKTYIVDKANMIEPHDEIYINQIGDAILQEHRTPIYVVTIESLAKYNKNPTTIESYATELFNTWEIGYSHRNYGALILVSKLDRKIRIELGADWNTASNADAKYIIDEVMVPRFKEGLFSDGIREGYLGVDKMARGLDLPRPYLPSWVLPALAAGAFICLCVGISFLRSGKKGFGWTFILLMIAVIGFIIELLGNSYGNDGFSGGGGSGSGFGGGGFSGGGGASGGW